MIQLMNMVIVNISVPISGTKKDMVLLSISSKIRVKHFALITAKLTTLKSANFEEC